MKKLLKRYRSVGVIAGSLLFNLVSSLLVYRPEGVIFNIVPQSVTEWICDIIALVVFFVGYLMLFYDFSEDNKQKQKEALVEGIIKAQEELSKDDVKLTVK